MRYVKFFYGFLNYKIAEGLPLEKHQSFFELALRKHNYLSFNRVFEDMRSEALDLQSICLGPFPQKVEKFDLKISTLQKAKIEKIMAFDENSLEKYMTWKQIIDDKLPGKVNDDQWYLVIELHKLEQRVYGDFKVNFESTTGM